MKYTVEQLERTLAQQDRSELAKTESSVRTTARTPEAASLRTTGAGTRYGEEELQQAQD